MTTLAVDKPRAYVEGNIADYAVAASTKIYEGAAVGVPANGYARPLQAGDKFVGFAEYRADNSAGVAGAVYVRVRRKGLIELPISALAITDLSKPVYASDDDTFTLTQSTNTHIGRVLKWVSTGFGLIAFDVENGAAGILTEFTAATGTASDTIADVTASPTQTLVNNNFKSLADKVNSIIRQLS